MSGERRFVLINTLIPLAREHIDGLADRLTCFHHHERQLEKWLQGELLYLLHARRADLGVERVRIEVPDAGGKVDLVVSGTDGTTTWIELKHWHIGYQAGTRWRAIDCLSPKDAFGLTKDVRRLVAPGRRGSGYAILLFTANPGENDWQCGVAAFNANAAPLYIEPLTSPSQFPATYFLAVVRAATRELGSPNSMP